MARLGWIGAALIAVCGMGQGAHARGETSAKGLLRVTATWGDDRYVAGWASQTVVSSDGRRVAVATIGGVIIFDVTGGPEVRIPMPATIWHGPQLAFGPGDRVLVTADGGDLAGWDVATGRKLGGAKPAGFDRPTVALAPGTSLVALWEFDDKQGHRLEIWDAQAGSRVREIQTPDFGVSRLTVTLVGNGRRVFVRAPDTQAHALLNVSDGKVVYRDRTGGHCESAGVCAPVTALLAPDGRTLVRTFLETASVTKRAAAPAPADRRIELVDLDGDRVTVLEKPPVGIDVALSADGRTLASAASEPGQIAIWDLGRRVRRTVKLAETGAARLVLSAHGSLLLVGGDVSPTESWLSLYRTSDGRRLWLNAHVPRRERVQPRYDVDDGAGLVICSEFCPPPDEVKTVAWDAATGNRAFDLPNSAGRGSWLPTVRGPFFPAPGVLDLRAATAPWPSLLPALGHAGGIAHLAVSRDGKWLAEASDDGRLLLRNLADPTQLVPLSDREAVQDLAFLPDRDALAVVHYQRAAIWDIAARKVVAETKADKDEAFGRLLPGGHRLAYDVHRRTIEIRSLDDGHRIETLAHPCGPEMPGLDLVDLSGAGLCATYEREDKGVIRALRNGAPRARYKTRHGLAQAVAVSKDGTRALVSHHSGQVILVALDGPGRVMQLSPLDDLHTPALAFSPDGRRALTGSIDGVLRLWDAKTGALLDSFSMAERIDYPRSMAWAPDGRTLFVGTARGLVYRIEDGAK